MNYYNNVSASIDNDDYFELMIRNAWHISGGEGWYIHATHFPTSLLLLTITSIIIAGVRTHLAAEFWSFTLTADRL